MLFLVMCSGFGLSYECMESNIFFNLSVTKHCSLLVCVCLGWYHQQVMMQSTLLQLSACLLTLLLFIPFSPYSGKGFLLLWFWPLFFYLDCSKTNWHLLCCLSLVSLFVGSLQKANCCRGPSTSFLSGGVFYSYFSVLYIFLDCSFMRSEMTFMF